MSNKSKMTKDVVPQNFTLGLTIVDLFPVIFFGISFTILGIKAGSWLFVTGALICLLSGALKVLWKLIVVLQKKNVWPLFIQMRIAMPVGFVLIIISCFSGASINFEAVFGAIMLFPQVLFFALGAFGLVLMFIFAFVLDSSDVRSNWIEQITNSIAQLSILIAIILC